MSEHGVVIVVIFRGIIARKSQVTVPSESRRNHIIRRPYESMPTIYQSTCILSRFTKILGRSPLRLSYTRCADRHLVTRHRSYDIIEYVSSKNQKSSISGDELFDGRDWNCVITVRVH